MPDLSWILSLKKYGKKLTAISFIVLILIGNVWVINRFTGESLPTWTVSIFQVGILFVFLGFLMMVPAWVYPAEIPDEVTKTSDDTRTSG